MSIGIHKEFIRETGKAPEIRYQIHGEEGTVWGITEDEALFVHKELSVLLEIKDISEK